MILTYVYGGVKRGTKQSSHVHFTRKQFVSHCVTPVVFSNTETCYPQTTVKYILLQQHLLQFTNFFNGPAGRHFSFTPLGSSETGTKTII